MPIYRYKCRECGADEEHIHKMSESGPDACGSCKAAGAMLKQMTSAAFQLKGGGWFKDSYSSTKPKASGCGSPNCKHKHH